MDESLMNTYILVRLCRMRENDLREQGCQRCVSQRAEEDARTQKAVKVQKERARNGSEAYLYVNRADSQQYDERVDKSSDPVGRCCAFDTHVEQQNSVPKPEEDDAGHFVVSESIRLGFHQELESERKQASQ